MSYRFVITAKSVAHLNEQILEAADLIRKIPGDVPVGTTSDNGPRIRTATETVELSKQQFNNLPKADLSANTLADRPANNRPFTQAGAIATGPAEVAAPATPKRRGPKTKAEKAATNSFIPQAPAAPVVNAQPMPTTQFNVGMPAMNQAPAAPVVNAQLPNTFAPPQAAPTPVNGYTFATFKANFIHIINTLANDGRIDESWVAVNADHFGGAKIQDWPKQEQVLEGLFDAMAQWQLIEKIG